MQSNFNEEMPQDESYYILDAKENSNVYLGFQENINEQEFRLQIEKSFHESVSIQIENYIQSHKSKKHDFFSIPHGTIHGSGKNNLVLEISSAPYIFTFKIYDWLRLDLDGRPRTLNIDRAFRNLDFSRKGDLIKQHINNIKVIYENSDCKIHCLSTNDEQYYDVHRIDLKSSFEFKTSDCFSVLSLVEGDSIEVETQNGYKKRFYYAETFIIPAAAVSFILTNIAHMPCKLLRVFIKPEYLLNQKTY
jgi:mannose-6-phosphate isomerase class I